MRSAGDRLKSLEVSPRSSAGERSVRRSPSDSKSISTPGSRKVVSPRSRLIASATSSPISPKDFLKRLVDRESFNASLHSWLQEKFSIDDDGYANCEPPFRLEELHRFDYAIEGVLFQQLQQMPSVLDKAEMCVATEDLMYASVESLWRSFWSSEEPLPFFVTSHGFDLKQSSRDKRGRSSWPQCAMLETAQSEPLPRALAAALKARKDAMPIKTRLTICNKEDGADSSDGDVLIFPDMVRYNGLTHTDVETFVDEVLMQNKEWQSGKPEKLEGAHIFVCAHGSRDARCGFCGPSLIKKFQEELSTSSLEGHAFVRSCSHIGGHKYAGNVIIYSQDSLGKMAGHWYGYVTPEDVPLLLNEHIGKGEIIDRIWRGQMGMTEEEQKQAHQSRILQCKATEKDENGCMCSGAVGGDGSVDKNGQAEELSKARGGEKKKKGQPSWCKMSNWLDGWDKQDTITAAVVIGAAASVAVAFYLTRRSSQTK